MTVTARTWLAAAVIAAGAVFSLANAAPLPSPSSNSVDDEFLAMANEFQLANGQSKVIAERKHPEEYRFCVKQGSGVVPLQVTGDGKVQKVNPGSCANVNAAMIKVAPAAKLPANEVLIGKYKRVSKG